MIYYGRELMSRLVVDGSTGKRIGRVTQVIWDPTNGQLLGLAVGEAERPSQVVSQRQIAAIEPGQITITPGEGAAVPEAGPVGIGKQLVTDDGRQYGPITDVIFDLNSQQVLAYEIDQSGKPLVVPVVMPIHETAAEVRLPAEAMAHAAPDLSALIAQRDPQTGTIMFPLSEEPPPV